MWSRQWGGRAPPDATAAASLGTGIMGMGMGMGIDEEGEK